MELGRDLRFAIRGLRRAPGYAVGAGRVLTNLLYEVQPADPLTLSAMAVLFLTVSTGAVLLPVWRATRVDLVLVLRQQ